MQTSQPKIPGIYLNQIAPQTQPELLTGVPLFLGLASAQKPGNEP